MLLDYIQLGTSLLSIFYTTATLPHQVRVLKPEDKQIKTFSMASVALVFWRSFIVGSRMLAFIIFASLFHYWLLVIIGCHYCLMFALVYNQMRLSKEKLSKRVVYTMVTPFIYIFDYCVNCLDGPTRYWYVMVYIPVYSENILMCAIGLWYASTLPNPAWYIVPGCVSAIVMFPLGVLAQLAYYRYWHPNAPVMQLTLEQTAPENTDGDGSQPSQSMWLQHMTWTEFRAEVKKANATSGHSVQCMPHPGYYPGNHFWGVKPGNRGSHGEEKSRSRSVRDPKGDHRVM